jgi:hypothetical protein
VDVVVAVWAVVVAGEVEGLADVEPVAGGGGGVPFLERSAAPKAAVASPAITGAAESPLLAVTMGGD